MMKIENKVMVEMAKEIEDKLKELLRMKVEVGYSVSSTSDVFIVDVYQSDYDYYRVKFNYHEEVSVDNYAYMTIDLVGKKMVNKDVEGHVNFYRASSIEKFIMELIKEHDAEDLIHIADGLLFGDFENQYIPLEDIKDIHYNEEDSILDFIEYDCDERHRYEINFKNETVQQVDISTRLSVLKGSC